MIVNASYYDHQEYIYIWFTCGDLNHFKDMTINVDIAPP